VLSVGNKQASNTTPNSVKPVQQQPLNTTQTNVHIVKENETLYGISLRVGIPVERIKEINGLKSDVIRPGQKLKLL
jgi:LysM repeat protein